MNLKLSFFFHSHRWHLKINPCSLRDKISSSAWVPSRIHSQIYVTNLYTLILLAFNEWKRLKHMSTHCVLYFVDVLIRHYRHISHQRARLCCVSRGWDKSNKCKMTIAKMMNAWKQLTKQRIFHISRNWVQVRIVWTLFRNEIITKIKAQYHRRRSREEESDLLNSYNKIIWRWMWMCDEKRRRCHMREKLWRKGMQREEERGRRRPAIFPIEFMIIGISFINICTIAVYTIRISEEFPLSAVIIEAI